MADNVWTTASAGASNIWSSSGPVGKPKDIQGTPTPLGFIKNLAGDFGQLAMGITGLVGAVGQDIYKAGMEFSTLGQYEDNGEGYRLAAIGKALLPALAKDYSRRYGGASNIARGLYEDPLSYVLDVLTIAGGAGAIAKAGRIGVYSNLPKLLSESTAESILGATKEALYQPVAKVASASLAKGVVHEWALSQNPATRALQQGLIKIGTQTPEKILQLGKKIPEAPLDQFKAALEVGRTIEPGILLRTEAAADTAVRMGIRIFRPKVGEFFAGTKAGSRLASLRVDQMELGREATQHIDKLFQTADDAENAAMISRGLAKPVERFEYDARPVVNRSSTLNTPSEINTISVDDLERAVPEKSPEIFFVSDTDAPHSMPGSRSYTQVVASTKDIIKAGDDVAAKLGLTDIKFKNYILDDKEGLYPGYHVFGKTPDGRPVDISIATPDMVEAQKTYTFLRNLPERGIDDVDTAILDASQVLSKVQDAFKAGQASPVDIVAAADELSSLMTEAHGLREILHTNTRYSRALDYGIETLDNDSLTALRTRADLFNTVTRRWFENQKGTATVYWERAYADARFQQFYNKLAELHPQFEEILQISKDNAEALPLVRDLLQQEGIPDEIISLIVGNKPWRTDAAAGARGLTRRYEKQLYDYQVVEGGGGVLGTEFPEYSWVHMHDVRVEQGIPIPAYYPHFAKKNSELGLARSPSPVPRRPGIAQHWRGRLMQEGRVITDPVEAHSRAAQILINHNELSSALENIIHETGRKLSRVQLIDFKANQYSGEVLIPLGKVKNELSLAAHILGDQLDALAEGETWTGATIRSFEKLADQAYEEALAGMLTTEVWAVPRAVGRKFQSELKYQTGLNLRTYWDGPMALWKASVLSLSPRWLAYNIFGNQIFMGLENPGALRLSLDQMSRKTAHITRQVLGEFEVKGERGFFTEASSYGTVIPEDATGILGAARAVKESVAGRTAASASRMIRNMNTRWEQAARRGVLLNEAQKRLLLDWTQGFHSNYEILNRLLREGDVTAAAMRPALKGIDRTLGNYTNYSAIEQNVIRRFLVPFWGFYRHAGKVLLRLPFEHPQKAFLLRQIEEVDKQMLAEGTPEWLRGSVTLGMLGGDEVMLRLQNFNPLNQFSSDIPMLGLLNPVPKMFIENQLGVDTFTGEPFRLPDDVTQSWNGNFYQALRDGQGNVVGTQLLKSPPNPGIFKLFMQQWPQLSVIPTFQRYPKNSYLQLLSLFGVPISRTNVQGIRESEIKAQQQALTTLQNRGGEAAPTNVWGG